VPAVPEEIARAHLALRPIIDCLFDPLDQEQAPGRLGVGHDVLCSITFEPGFRERRQKGEVSVSGSYQDGRLVMARSHRLPRRLAI
jgi:hypothetical protein